MTINDRKLTAAEILKLAVPINTTMNNKPETEQPKYPEGGPKFLVIRGGRQQTGHYGGTVTLKLGQVWDLVKSASTGDQFRLLKPGGGSTCILNGCTVANYALRDGRIRPLLPSEPEAVAHDELRKRTGAR